MGRALRGPQATGRSDVAILRGVSFFFHVAEARIREAIDRGLLDDLPGKGQPLPADDAEDVPSELRGAYRILRNANVLPEELVVHRDLLTLGDLLAACHDEAARDPIRRRIAAVRVRYELLKEERLRRERERPL